MEGLLGLLELLNQNVAGKLLHRPVGPVSMRFVVTVALLSATGIQSTQGSPCLRSDLIHRG